MRNNSIGTWDYFYSRADASERDAVAAAKRLEWCGMTAEEETTVAEALAVLRKYELA